MISNHLVCHPGFPCPAVRQLSVNVQCLPDKGLFLQYHLQGDLQQLRIPELQAPAMTDGLWQHTCFEAFIAREGGASYQEFNFSPSQQWAAYLFDDYRIRNPNWLSRHRYTIYPRGDADNLWVDVVIPLAELALVAPGQIGRLGLTAVIETVEGGLSYWALRHPAEKPDFHHSGGFICPINLSR